MMLKRRILEFFKPKKSLKIIKQARLKGYDYLKQNKSENQLPEIEDAPKEAAARPPERHSTKKLSLILQARRLSGALGNQNLGGNNPPNGAKPIPT